MWRQRSRPAHSGCRGLLDSCRCILGDRCDRCAEEGALCPDAERCPAAEAGRVATGVSCSSKDTGVSCTEAGRPRRADEGGLGERGVSWTEEGRPKSERRTEEGPPGLIRMLASEAAGRGRVWEADM